jgi:hypothetical protein
VKEILETESYFIFSLSTLLEYYMNINKKINTTNLLHIISEKEYNILFSNIEQIYKLNSEFLKILEKESKKINFIHNFGNTFFDYIFNFISCKKNKIL